MSNDVVRPATLGVSIPVQNVQALADDPAALTPESLLRYIRPDQLHDAPVLSSGCIPVVDLSKLVDPEQSAEEAAVLKLACEEWGFFQVVNHGVEGRVMEKMKSSLRRFFAQPLEKRMEVAQRPGDIEGYGQLFVVSEEQKLDWADMIFLLTLPPHYRRQALWTSLPADLRESLECYCQEMMKINRCLTEFMAKNLGIAPDRLARALGAQSVRINYYPRCPTAHEKVIGLSPHSDGSGLTLLLHANDAPGLQVRRGGSWLLVNPIPNALVANVGDLLEIMTNGKYRSIEHRATVNAETERITVAAFHYQEYGRMVGPLPEIVENDGRAKYRTMSNEDYDRLFLSSKLDGKSGSIDRMKLES